jgi:hypothetical protein
MERLKAKFAKNDEIIAKISEEYVTLIKNFGSSGRALGSSLHARSGG